MGFKQVMATGEYLGFCKQKGDIYSVLVDRTLDNLPIYAVCAVSGSEVTTLIKFEGVAC